MPYRKPLTGEELKKLQEEVKPISQGFDYIGDHVVITDPDGNIIYANRAVENHTGFSLNEVIGKNPGDLWGGLMQKETYEHMWRVIKEEKRPFIADVQNRNNLGEPYWQELRIFPVLDDQTGEVKFFIGIEPDATIRKAFEGQTSQYVEELERLNEYLEGREVKIKELTERVDKLKAARGFKEA